MLLGDLMTRLQSDAGATLALETLGDIVLLSEVSAMGARFDEAPGAYVTGAAARFANSASDEDWLSLVAVIEKGQDPAREALARMLRWSIDRDARELAADGATLEDLARSSGACSCGGAGGGCHGDP